MMRWKSEATEAFSALVVDQLLDYIRNPNECGSALSLSRILRRAVMECRIPTGIEILRPFETPRIQVFANERQVMLMLTNLIYNASELLGKGGFVVLRCLQGDGGQGIVKLTTSPTDRSRRVMGTISRPIYSPRFAGPGIGLPIARRYAELNGGTMEVRNSARKGLSVTVQLPSWIDT